MALFHRASKLALLPAGPVAAAASSILLSSSRRYTSEATNQKVTQLANRHFNANASRYGFSLSSRLQQHRQISASNVKKSNSASVQNETLSSSTEATTKSKGFVEWYEGHLKARPITTKACTGAVLWGIGDVVAQVVPVYFDEGEDSNDNNKKKEFHYDVPRTARAITFGFAIHAPLSHLHFNFLEWMAVRGGFQGLNVTVFKTIMEQFVYWSWFSNSLYHGAMGAMQGMSLDQIYTRIADVLWDTQVAQWKFWIPVQLLNFQFTPVHHQLNVVLLTSIVWTALLSAWYPPEQNKEEEEDEVEKREESE
jgi:protein Mpv17